MDAPADGAPRVVKVMAVLRRHRDLDDAELWARAKVVAPHAAVVGWTAMVADESQAPIGGGDPTGQAVVGVHLDPARGPLPSVAELLPGLRAEAYAVDEHVQWDRHGTWTEGERGPGFTRVAMPRRRDDRDAAHFAHWWTQVHAELAHRHHPGIGRYVQNVVRSPWPGSAEPERGAPDGIAELHFLTLADFAERMYDSEEGRRITRADVASCLDPSKGERFLTGRWVQRAAPPVPARRS